MSTATPKTLDSTLFNGRLYRRILALWFDDLPRPASAPPFSLMQRWFGINLSLEDKAAFDTSCRALAEEPLLSIGSEQFPLPAAASGSHDSVDETIASPFASHLQPDNRVAPAAQLAPEETALALILLLDQLSRNCFRAEARHCYQHYDRISRAILRNLVIPQGLDMSERYRDSPPWVVWFYLPLMHSEDLRDHDFLSKKLEDLKKRMDEKGDQEAADYVKNTMGFEQRHRVILERFSRYPHRNKVMGREHTNEEEKYMNEGGESFGG